MIILHLLVLRVISSLLVTRDVPLISSVTVEVRDVLKAITKLMSNLSAGPDRQPPLLFKRVKYALAFPLTLMFRQTMLSFAFVPEIWKNAVITPGHKNTQTFYCSSGICPGLPG